MTDQQQYPMTPPPELKQQLREKAPLYRVHDDGAGREEWMMDRAAQWGYERRGEVNEVKLQQARDQELEACCEWMSNRTVVCPSDLRAARRPKPPSLKEQALEALDDVSKMSETLYSSYDPPEEIYSDQVNIIRRALEALPDD